MTLYEIDQALLDCIDAETGEIVDIDKLSELQMERDTKIENVALWIKELKAEAEALKVEKLAFADRQKKAENKAERLSKWLTDALAGQTFKTSKVAVSFRRTEIVQINNVYDVDENYLRYKEPEVDKKAIKEALKAGQTVKGAQLVENVSINLK